MSTIDVTRLRVFRAVLASGTVQAAATHLGYSPSAVSQHLAALQRETGLALLEKSGRGLVPTAAGRLLAGRSDEVMDSLSRLDTLVTDLREGRTGNVRIATIASVGEMWLPEVARVLRTEFPDVVLTLDLNEYPMEPGATADIDVRSEHPGETPVERTGYVRVPLAEEPYLLVVPADHPFAEEGQVPMSALAGEPLIDDNMADTICGRIQRTAWRAAGLTPRFVARTGDHHGAMAFVAGGVGVFMGPRLALGNPPDSVRLVKVVDPVVTRRLVAYVREGSDTNPAVVRALQLLRTVARQHGR